MRYEPIQNVSRKGIEQILKGNGSDESKIHAFYSCIYEEDENYAESIIIYCLENVVFTTPLLAARAIVPFMQSRRIAEVSKKLLENLECLVTNNPEHEGELREIMEDIHELSVINGST